MKVRSFSTTETKLLLSNLEGGSELLVLLVLLVLLRLHAGETTSLHRPASHSPSPPLSPSSSCDSVHGSNSANRSHTVPLMKFSDVASNKWRLGRSPGRESKKQRRPEEKREELSSQAGRSPRQRDEPEAGDKIPSSSSSLYFRHLSTLLSVFSPASSSYLLVSLGQ
ncbi:unnamed protein product [Pleuronectes platessa]|uniref:Uncharacterized protein n=1 Tax=Pleuronectes platessa TaxID=8262 RepID=A0A9N7VMU2_PLEPL|nr:unnamed protein product [Pleuronectes platessa]